MASLPLVDYPYTEEENEEVRLECIKRIQEERIAKKDLNLLVFDTLLYNNLHEVVKLFSNESNDTSCIEDCTPTRTFVKIKEAICKRQFDTTIGLLNNELGEDFLKTRPYLYFDLEKCKFLHLFCSGETKAVLTFTSQFSRWRYYEFLGHQVFKKSCQKTLCKLLKVNLTSTSVATRLMEESELLCLISDIITKLARYQKCETDGMIKRALKMVAQDQLELKKYTNFPGLR